VPAEITTARIRSTAFSLPVFIFVTPLFRMGCADIACGRNLRIGDPRSIRHSRSNYSDQGRIWQSVHAKLEAMEVMSETASMEEVYSAHESTIQAYIDNLACPGGA